MIHKRCREILDRYHSEKGNVTTILQDMQDTFGFIPEEAVDWFSRELNIPASSFYGIATFYDEFYLKPRGKHIVSACCDTACFVKGSEGLITSFKRKLSITEGEDTSEDRKYTIQKGSCVGACSIAPVVTVGKKVYGKVTPDMTEEILKDHD